jgi:hypothetical protein
MKDPSFSKAAVEPSRLCGKVKKDVQASVSTISSYFMSKEYQIFCSRQEVFLPVQIMRRATAKRITKRIMSVGLVVYVRHVFIPTGPTSQAFISLS